MFNLFTDAHAAADISPVIQVKVAFITKENNQTSRRELVTLAQKEAIKKYISLCNASVPEKLLHNALNNYALYIQTTKLLNAHWMQMEPALGEISGDFVITLSAGKIHRWMIDNGYMQQGNIELIIMEELPDLAGIKLDEIKGMGVDGNKFYLQRYTTFQKRIRDILLKRMEEHGFLIHLLEDKNVYSKYKSKNGTLVGVYFDSDRNQFVLDHELLDAVKANNPGTLILSYRIDSIMYLPETSEISTTINLSIKDLKTGITRSVGTRTRRISCKETSKEMLMQQFANCLENCIDELIDQENAAARLNSAAIFIKNQARQPQAPLKFVLNTLAFDKKIRKRVMYMMRKYLLKQQLASRENISSTDTTLIAVINKEKCNDKEVLYMEYIYPYLESIGLDPGDDKVYYEGQTLLIKP